MNANVIAYLPNSRIPTIQQYNLCVQQQIEKNTIVTISYVGTKADHLLTSPGYSNPQLVTGTQFFRTPGLTVTENAHQGSSHYHGLQTSLNHRLVNGLQVTAASTWSHNIDHTPSPYSGNQQAPVPVTANGPQLGLNRGNADDDQRHSATFSALATTRLDFPFSKKFK